MTASSWCSVFSHCRVHKHVKIFCLVFSLCLQYFARPDIHHWRPFVMCWQYSSHITRCPIPLQLEINGNTLPVLIYTSRRNPYGWQSCKSTHLVPVRWELHVPVTFVSEERISDINCAGEWVCSWDRLEVSEKKQFSHPCRESIHDTSVVQAFAYSL